MKDLYKRVSEYKERPQAMEALKSTLNHTKFMVKSMQNFSMTAPEGEGPFTEVELTTLETLYKGQCAELKSYYSRVLGLGGRGHTRVRWAGFSNTRVRWAGFRNTLVSWAGLSHTRVG